jgi:hypothetical protein
MGAAEEFADFAAAAATQLRRIAFLPCGNWQEPLAPEAFAPENWIVVLAASAVTS